MEPRIFLTTYMLAEKGNIIIIYNNKDDEKKNNWHTPDGTHHDLII